MLHFLRQKIWKTQHLPQDRKRLAFFQIPKEGSAKECSSYCTFTLTSHDSKEMLRILQASFQQYMFQEHVSDVHVPVHVPDVQAGFTLSIGT